MHGTGADAQPAPQPLWPAGAPGAKGNLPEDIPSIQIYLAPADKATGAAILVCPGGGYEHLAPHEGHDVAVWLSSIGVTAVVLKYRLGPRYHYPAQLQDAQRALRTMRGKASGWKIDPQRVGVMGFSAGGHLASTAATHFDDGDPGAADPIERQSCRPDVAILCYPYQHGRHGVGLAPNEPELSTWPNLLVNWLRARGFLKGNQPVFGVLTVP